MTVSGRARGRQAAFSALLLLALASAAVPEKEKFSFATIGEACAPQDGPAVELHFSTAPLKCGPGDAIELTLSFWRDLPLHDNQTFSLDAKSNWGGASYCQSGHWPCERATSGTVHIETITQDKAARGTYELTFPKLGRVNGSFHADWCKRRGLCR